jgi:hypothetical protein
MPHRIQFLSTAMSYTVEGILLLSLAVANGGKFLMGIIMDSDWEKITGPHAFLFGLVIAVGVLWNSGRVQEKKENVRREREEAARENRHNQLVATNKENAESLKALTVESIKAQAKATHAVETMDKNIQRLTIELGERPCQAIQFRPVPGSMPTINHD